MQSKVQDRTTVAGYGKIPGLSREGGKVNRRTLVVFVLVLAGLAALGRRWSAYRASLRDPRLQAFEEEYQGWARKMLAEADHDREPEPRLRSHVRRRVAAVVSVVEATR
jgi:hypothetical protein